MTTPTPTAPAPAPTLTDAELIEALIAEVRRAYYPYLSGGHEFAERIYTLGKELESRLAAPPPAGGTPNYDAALAKWNEWEDENADLMRWDGDVRYQAMCAAVDAACATADAAAEGE